MSKETFSKTITETMDSKILLLENYMVEEFLKKDEYLELALSIAYMTLSKEKIIKKDKDNTDRINRLTNYADINEIEKLFTKEFCLNPPTIIAAEESNKLWILDNIRDSIMHGVFEIDEERKCFILNNTQSERLLKAEIPFEWFIKYTKNDIVKKKLANVYTVKGLYINNYKLNKKHFNTDKEIKETILYNVEVRGNKFNIYEVETTIKKLFEKYSKEKNNPKELKINNNTEYNTNYFKSYKNAEEKVIKEMKKLYPKIKLDIWIEKDKTEFITKASKKIKSYYNNYDYLFLLNELDNIMKPKGMVLLNTLSLILENIDKLNDVEGLDRLTILSKFNNLFETKSYNYKETKESYDKFRKNLTLIKLVCLNAMGINTLVFNEENIYDKYYENENPKDYFYRTYFKGNYDTYTNEYISNIDSILTNEISLLLSEKDNKCYPNNLVTIDKINKATKNINDLTNAIKNLDTKHNYKRYEFNGLNNNIDYINIKEQLLTSINEFNKVLERLYNVIDNTNDLPTLRKIKTEVIELRDLQSIIKEQLKELKKIESEYVYSECVSMKDAITIIRNSLSHIGRITLENHVGTNSKVILGDYDDKGNKSGEIISDYNILLEFIKKPLKNIKKVK